MQARELAQQYVQEAKMMQLATVRNDQPWCCTLFYVPAQNLSLYWISLPDTQHSQELKDNSRVAVTVPVRYVPGRPVIGVSMEGTAQIVENPEEVKTTIRRYTDRFDRGEEWYEEYMAGKNPHKLYRMKPVKIVLFDSEHFPNDPRQEFRP